MIATAAILEGGWHSITLFILTMSLSILSVCRNRP